MAVKVTIFNHNAKHEVAIFNRHPTASRATTLKHIGTTLTTKDGYYYSGSLEDGEEPLLIFPSDYLRSCMIRIDTIEDDPK